MRIALDAMGTDDHPAPEIEAVAQALDTWHEPILLVGPKERLGALLAARGISKTHVEIVHAPTVLEMTDKPAEAARAKPDSSMAVGMRLLKEGRADALVTCGNTGGALATAIFGLGRIRGMKRPALAAVFPVRQGSAVVLDIGANTDCKAEYLVQFAIIGGVYAEKVLGRRSPTVGLLSNGEEAGKGNQLIKDSHALLEKSDLNYLGNIEPKEVYAGGVDVVISDGFVGNVFLKTSEAVAALLVELIGEEIRRQPLTSLGGILARPAFRRVRDILDPAEYGAGILLGVDGLVFIGHGRSQAKAVFHSIRVARQAVGSDLLAAMQAAIHGRLYSSKPKEAE